MLFYIFILMMVFRDNILVVDGNDPTNRKGFLTGNNICRRSKIRYTQINLKGNSSVVLQISRVVLLDVCCKGFVKKSNKCIRRRRKTIQQSSTKRPPIKTNLTTQKNVSNVDVAMDLVIALTVGVTVLIFLVSLVTCILCKKSKENSFCCCCRKVDTASTEEQSTHQYEQPVIMSTLVDGNTNPSLKPDNKVYTELQYSATNIYEDLTFVQENKPMDEVAPENDRTYSDYPLDEILYEVPPEYEEEMYIEIINK